MMKAEIKAINYLFNIPNAMQNKFEENLRSVGINFSVPDNELSPSLWLFFSEDEVTQSTLSALMQWRPVKQTIVSFSEPFSDRQLNIKANNAGMIRVASRDTNFSEYRHQKAQHTWFNFSKDANTVIFNEPAYINADERQITPLRRVFGEYLDTTHAARLHGSGLA